MLTTLSLRTIFFDVGSIVQAVPHPESHITGNEQRFLADGFIINDTGYINQSGQLLMHGIIRCPYPVFVVIGTIHLYEHAVLWWNGIDVAIAVVTIVLLIVIEIFPRAFQFTQLCLRCHVTGLEIAA